MRCHEARQFLGPYLDSELDAKTTQEIEMHLESCPDCARVFASEELLDGRIFAALRQGSQTPEFWKRLEGRIKPRRPVGLARWAALRVLPVAAAAGVVILVVVLWPKAAALDLAAAAEKHHRAYVDQVMQPEFTGAVPPEIARRLDDKLDAQAFLVRPSDASFSVQGARLCHIAGAPIAWILGRYDNVPVSLLVLKQTQLEHFPKLQQRLPRGGGVLCSRSGRYQFAARLIDGHVVCAMGGLPRAELEALVKSVSGPA